MSANFISIIRHNLCRGKYKFARRPVLINNWEATHFDFNEEKIFHCQTGIGAGSRCWCWMTLVWQPGTATTRGLGDWFVNTDKLKGGLTDLVTASLGSGHEIRHLIEPEMVNEDSRLYREHPDWALTIPGRKPQKQESAGT